MLVVYHICDCFWLFQSSPHSPQGAMLDPLLDDAVVFAKRLQAAKQPVTLDVFPDLPHGFLSLISAGNDPQLTAAHRTCLNYMKLKLGLSKGARPQGNPGSLLPPDMNAQQCLGPDICIEHQCLKLVMNKVKNITYTCFKYY